MRIGRDGPVLLDSAGLAVWTVGGAATGTPTVELAHEAIAHDAIRSSAVARNAR
jgi:hypothetical protein